MSESDILVDQFDDSEDTETLDKEVLNDKRLKELMNIEYTYPGPDDDDFQEKVYRKREFYYHRIPERSDIHSYDDIKEYRDKICRPSSFQLQPPQAFLSNFINPETPYKGVLVFHGTGVGKSAAAIAIAEKFKPMVQKYGTKIHILVGGPIIKENWKDELLKSTGETYLKEQDLTVYTNQQEKERIKKNAISIALQYYRFMSYRSFYKKVLGEKMKEVIKTEDEKVKVVYRKTEEGEFERDIAIDRIHSLNNTLIIVDEAHNLTGNAYGEALMKVIENSHNLKIVLLSATPMKNLADDIVELVNFLRPIDKPMHRDKIFNSYKNHEMDFKPGGIEYLKKKIRGYVSYVRGSDPLTFAKRIDKGIIPPGLYFTKMTPCHMLPFQKSTYDEAISAIDDSLDRRSEAVANFVFPGLNEKKELVGYYGREGINIVKNQLKSNQELLHKKIATEILKDESLADNDDLLYITEDGKTVTGKIFQMEYLKLFSIKFYKALKKVNRLIWGKKGARTGFVYSNLVKVGIEIFQEILLMNGYLEYDENPANYKIKSTTRCYFCGRSYSDHKQEKIQQKIQTRMKNISESSTEYEKPKDKEIPEHVFYPATFISVTGKPTEEAADVIPEEKQYILRNVFSSMDNLDGKHIKLVLGSKVMNEGISLKNVAEVHILDVYFNLGKVDQVIGRAIRHCSHINIMNEDNPYPTVNVYKYAVTIEKGLSSEEELYKKAELKYLLIKKVERAVKESAIDCALNRPGNLFPEDLKKYKDCIEPLDVKTDEDREKLCPALCDYTTCEFKCDSNLLNEKYFDGKKYRALNKTELDHATFTQTLAKNEIEITKIKIKDLYRIKYLYTLKDILNYVRNSYEGEKKELFDDFFVFEALNQLTPITENDFNNFRDTVFDKFNRPGYLIYVDKYYIFQLFDQNENIPMYHRTVFDKPIQTRLTLYNYLKNIEKVPLDKVKKREEEDVIEKPSVGYDFDSVMEYYDSRDEFKYVGIIDKESSRRKIKSIEELVDVFKIREKRPKVLIKKRSTGLSSLFGSVCSTSKSKEALEEIAKKLGVKSKPNENRSDICDHIRDQLLFLEKYSTGKDNMTYVMIPANHPKYPFPYNLEDRVKYIQNKIKEKIKFKLDINIKKNKMKVNDQQVMTYSIEISNGPNLKEFEGFFKSLGFMLQKNLWILNIN